MHTFKAWSPFAKTIFVKIGNDLTPMQRGDGDWWIAEVSSAGPGTDYQFVIEGGKSVPDPRSAWQPQGPNGPSRIVDHALFSWTDTGWQAKPLTSAILYELHVGTFTGEGTFLSAITRLDYLVELGITHVQLMPVNQFSGPWGWGYDGVDLYAPQNAYGTPDDLKRLVDACHARGLAVLLDVVYNHFGPSGNYLPEFGPYLTEAYRTPWGPAVNLDHENSHEIRSFFRDNALMWLRDYHFDGLRLDAIHAFFDRSAVHFLEFLSESVDELSAHLGRHLILIAESDLNDPRIVREREAHGFGIDAQWSDDFHHALHCVLTGETKGYYEDFGALEHLAKALQHAYVYDGVLSKHRKRIHGRPTTGIPGHRFLAFSQNHDQIGNRAQGERLSHLVSVALLKVAAALVLTSPFVPMLFQGEEFGSSSPFLYFSQHQDAELGNAVSEGRKNEFKAFGWNPDQIPDPQDPATFERSKLHWDEINKEPHSSLLDWYKFLIALRRSNSSLTDARMDRVQIEFDERAKWISIRREDLQVICNLSSNRQSIPAADTMKHVVTSEDYYSLRPGSIELPAESVAILSPIAFTSVHQHLRQYASA